MHIGPQDRTIYALDNMQHMVMIIPVDGDVKEAEYVAEKIRNKTFQSPHIDGVGWSELQHHNSNNDSNNTVAKSG
jgi:hypothetical protein